MGSRDRHLEAQSETKTSEDLVSNPLRGWSPDVKSIQQTDSDRTENTGNDHERQGAARDGDADAGGDSGQGNSEDQGQVSDTTLNRRDVVDDLEVDREVVEHEEVGAGDGERVCHTLPDISVLQQARGKHSPLAQPPLVETERDKEQTEPDEESNDRGIVPRQADTSPLQCEDVADDSCEHEDNSRGIELEHLLPERGLGGLDVGWEAEEDDENGSGEATDR